jgi:preprotein translocase subunit SecA
MVAGFVQTLTSSDMTWHVDEFGLQRPSATWTYMVTDDPFGTTGDRMTRELGRL